MIYVITIFLGLALVCIGVLVWYIRQLVKYLNSIETDFYTAAKIVGEYNDHLQQVYNSERYFGDSTLEGLMEHTNDISQELTLFTGRLNDLIEKPVGSNEEKEE